MPRTSREVTRIFCHVCRRLKFRAHARKVDEACDGTETWICGGCDDPEREEYERAVARDPNGGEGWS